jgi:hypothetical protein
MAEKTLLAAYMVATITMSIAFSAEAQGTRGGRAASRDGVDVGYVYGGIGIGRAAFPIPGAIPEGTRYDPYHLPYSYDWPYGYGFSNGW